MKLIIIFYQLQFRRKYSLHLISDEIYALSTYGCTFRSIATFLEPSDFDFVHILWGFSKDFGLGGWRIGMVYTRNISLTQSLASLAYFWCPSSVLQYLLTSLLSNDSFLENYIKENSNNLNKAYNMVSSALSECQIPFVHAVAGMFVWVDLRSLLKISSWTAERNLFEAMFEEEGIVLTPGESNFTNHPGYFRFCFAFNDLNLLREGLNRFIRFINNNKKLT